jgi:hypothetical protein
MPGLVFAPQEYQTQRLRSKAGNKLKSSERSRIFLILGAGTQLTFQHESCVSLRICHVILELHSRATTTALVSYPTHAINISNA